MTTLKKMLCVCVMAAVLVMTFPVSSLAVDPVSAAVMANAAAQAIAAYGASQGVSMSFDVGNTDGIGESVHDLWTQFKEDSQNSNLPTYDSFAVNIWTGLYSKIGDKIGINISSENVDVINQFWDWLLSGPAEMQKVDNQYYEFSSQSSTIPVLSISETQFGPYKVNTNSLPETFRMTGNGNRTVSVRSSSPPNYYTCYINSAQGSNDPYYFIVFAPSSMTIDVTNPSASPSLSATNGSWRWYGNGVFQAQRAVDSPYNNVDSTTFYNWLSSLSANATPETINSGIDVKPYGNQLSVSFPAASPYTGTLDNSWDNTAFGDGTGTLTDAQSAAISNSLSQTLVQSGELTLDAAADINASEVYIPFLPITLPAFNFSLSGIWHYVVSWVESLGAWLSTMFTVWEVVPSALTIPVYASAVIVIVLGVYKRFFM